MNRSAGGFDSWHGFDIEALYDAFDVQRRLRGMSWEQATNAINGSPEPGNAGPGLISASTLRGMRERAAVEGDGVLQMLRWLDRMPESFVPGRGEPIDDAARLPPARPGQVLRFDTKAIFSALDAERVERRMTWKQVAFEIGGMSGPSLTRLAAGGRTGFPQIVRITGWLNRPVAYFVRAFDR